MPTILPPSCADCLETSKDPPPVQVCTGTAVRLPVVWDYANHVYLSFVVTKIPLHNKVP